MEKIKQARRAAFESSVARDWDEHLAHFDRDGDGYVFGDIQAAWWAFNAALDCVVIELPAFPSMSSLSPTGVLLDKERGVAITECRAAIESTSLGIKVK